MILNISGHNYTLRDFENVRQELHKFYERYGKKKQPTQVMIRTKNPSLYHQLRLWGYKLSGKGSPRYAIKEMGRDIKTVLSLDEIKEQFKSVFNPEYVSKFYGTPGKRVSIKKEMLDAGQRQKQAYFACFFKKRNLSLKDIINGLHGEHPDLYDALHGSLLTNEVIGDNLIDLYYQGKDLSPGAIERTNSIGSRIKHQLQKSIKSDKGSEKYWHNMLKFLPIPRINISDLRSDGQDARAVMSQIVELQAQFLLEIVKKYDPECSSMSDTFKKLFGPKITAIYPRSNQGMVELENGNTFADARIQSGLEDILLEVKNKNLLTDSLHKRLRKYDSKHYWNDSKRITKKVLLVNTIDECVSEHFERFERKGWDVWNTTQFFEDYKKAIDILMQNDPLFFQKSMMPMQSQELMMDIAKEITTTPHLLMRRSHAYKRNWIKTLLKENILALTKNIPNHERENYAECYREPFLVFDQYYHGREKVSVPNVLFVDLETTGHLKNGSMIVVLGMAYMHEGQMYTELLFARNPQEEKRILERFNQLSQQYDTIATFNGDSFDKPFLQERLNAHLIRYPKEWNHVDVYKKYKQIAKKNKYPTASLQTYERTELGLIRRGDILGKDIPQAYKDFINGIDDHTIKKVITHNHLDVISLAIIYDQYYQKK
jgi:uncharacterized protein YprB with RNaseH-like and TPR domain